MRDDTEEAELTPEERETLNGKLDLILAGLGVLIAETAWSYGNPETELIEIGKRIEVLIDPMVDQAPARWRSARDGLDAVMASVIRAHAYMLHPDEQ